MTQWCSMRSTRPLSPLIDRQILQLAARGEFRLSDVARLSRQPALGTILRVTRSESPQSLSIGVERFPVPSKLWVVPLDEGDMIAEERALAAGKALVVLVDEQFGSSSRSRQPHHPMKTPPVDR